MNLCYQAVSSEMLQLAHVRYQQDQTSCVQSNLMSARELIKSRDKGKQFHYHMKKLKLLALLLTCSTAGR